MRPLSRFARSWDLDGATGLEAIERTDVRPAFWDEGRTSVVFWPTARLVGATLVLVLPPLVAILAALIGFLGFGSVLRSLWVGPIVVICYATTLMMGWDLLGRFGLSHVFLPPASFRRARSYCVEWSVLGIGDTSHWTSHRVVHDAESALAGLGLNISPATQELAHQTTGRRENIRSSGTTSVTTTVSDAAAGVIGRTGQAAMSPSKNLVRYTAERGDTWWGLAETIYGDGLMWAELRNLNSGDGLVQANLSAVVNDSLRGRKLVLPAEPSLPLPEGESVQR